MLHFPRSCCSMRLLARKKCGLAFRRALRIPSASPTMSLGRTLLPVLAAVALAVVTSCAGQGEGELCNTKAGNNGNDDCQGGLVCVTSPNYVNGRCCPQDRNQARTAVCS